MEERLSFNHEAGVYEVLIEGGTRKITVDSMVYGAALIEVVKHVRQAAGGWEQMSLRQARAIALDILHVPYWLEREDGLYVQVLPVVERKS